MRHIKLEILFGFPECDSIDIKELKDWAKEDALDWFACNFFDGDKDRPKLLALNVDKDYE